MLYRLVVPLFPLTYSQDERIILDYEFQLHHNSFSCFVNKKKDDELMVADG
ncbi:MAG: hypothetical protein ACLTID_04560 [Barnesiella sp.]